MSSTCSAVLANSSLTSIPLWPYFRNWNGEGNAAPVLRSVVRICGAGLPAYFSRAGLGSKVSTCDGPPLRKKWTTRFALPGKCGGFTRHGVAGRTLAPRGPLLGQEPAQAQRPQAQGGALQEGPAAQAGREVVVAWDSSPSSIDEHQLVGHEEHLGQLFPGREPGLGRAGEVAGRVPVGGPGPGRRSRISGAQRNWSLFRPSRKSTTKSIVSPASTSTGSDVERDLRVVDRRRLQDPVAAGDDPAADRRRRRPPRGSRSTGSPAVAFRGRRPAADGGVLEVVARVPALGGEPDPAQGGVGPLRAAPQADPLKWGSGRKSVDPAGAGVDRPVAVAPGQGLGRGRRARAPRRPLSRKARAARPALRSARAGRRPDTAGGRASAASAALDAGGQGLRPAGEERVIEGEEGLLRDRGLAPRGDVQVGVGEVEDPEHARQELPIHQPVDRPPGVGPAGREQLGRPAADPAVQLARDGQERVAELLERQAGGGSSARAGGSRGRPAAPARTRGSSGPSDRC